MIRRPPRSTLFPTRRSSDLERVPRSGSSAAAKVPPSPTHREPGRESRRSEEHTSELQSQSNLVCRLLLAKKKQDTAYFHLPCQYLAGRKATFLQWYQASCPP